MEITGKITQILPEKSGQSGRGTWRKQEYILEIPGQYPKNVCFMVWGDKIDELAIREGQELVVSIDIESREYNGRWYTDVKAWKVAPVSGGDAGGPPPADEPPPVYGDDVPF
jgi:hypothetical protein